MYGREFLSDAQTTKCRIAEEDNDVLYGHSLERHSLCWHSTNILSRQHIHMWVISHPLCKETITLVLVFNLVFISTIFRQMGFNLRPSRK